MPSRLVRLLSISVLSSLLSSATLAAIAFALVGPTTPTFMLAWGSTGSAPGQFSSPFFVTTDPQGNVYVPDPYNNRIQKFDGLGNFILQWGSAGNGNGQFNAPTDIAIDASGNVYVTDYFNNRVQKFDASGNYVLQWGTTGSGNGQFSGAEGVAVDADGNVYVGDYGHNRIEKFTSTGAYLTQWGSGGTGNGQFNGPEGIAIDYAGNVLVSDSNNNRIESFSNTGTYISQWGGLGTGNGQFNYCGAVAVDALGNVYVADSNNNRVEKFDHTGTYLTKWGTTGSGNGQFNGLFGVGVDGAGSVYTTEFNNNRVQKFSGAGVGAAQVPDLLLLQWGSSGSGNGQFDNPSGMATDAAGNVYVTDSNNNRVEKFTSAGAYLTQWGSSGSGNSQFNAPASVATDAAGNVYVLDVGNSRVQKFSAAGAYLTQWGSFGTGNGQFTYPIDLAADAAGNVYVADHDQARVQKFSSNGTFLTQWGGCCLGNGQFVEPWGIATDPLGNVYVTDINLNRIQKFTSNGTYLTQWGGLFVPHRVTTDAVGNVYVEDSNAGIIKFTGNGTYLTQWAYGAQSGVATDPAGNLYAADPGNNRVLKYASAARIALVSDVGNDQGKQLRLRILRSSLDAAGTGATITGYEVYRKIEALPGPTGPAGLHGDMPSSVQLAGWEQVDSISAHGESEYNAIAPTLANSNASSLYYTTFLVRAITPNPLTFFDSSVDYGYSIDNLSPPPPSPFTAAFVSGATHLHWGVSAASDFAAFKLYRGASSTFTPAPGNLVTTTTDTGYVDAGPAGGYYKLSAVDLNGNMSSYALVGPGQTSDVSGAAPLVFALEPARSNPARHGRLSVRFTLPIAAPARVEVLDVAGRAMMTREVGGLGAGEHTLDLTERTRMVAGLYFVRLRQGPNVRTIRLTMLE